MREKCAILTIERTNANQNFLDISMHILCIYVLLHVYNLKKYNKIQNRVLYSLTPSGMPSFNHNFKIGVVIMLLRNLNPSEDLCNGTRTHF